MRYQSTVNTILHLENVIVQTKVEEVDIEGTTELTAAVVNAVEQLTEFNCRRLRGMSIDYYIVKNKF